MRAVLTKTFAALLVAGAAVVVPAGPALAATGVFVSRQDGRCLDADVSGPTHDGTKVQVWQCNGWLNQTWTWYTDGTIRSAHDGRCLDEDIAGGTRNGSRAQMWDCNGWPNQQWHR